MCAEPKLVIADEPTTALDVSIQAQVIALLRRLAREHGTAIMLVTHDMGVIAETCDRVAVMYAGRVIEVGSVAAVVHRAAHPYTAGADGLDPRARPPGRTPGPDRRGDASPRRHAPRLPLQPALPPRVRPLPNGAPRTDAGQGKPRCLLALRGRIRRWLT